MNVRHFRKVTVILAVLLLAVIFGMAVQSQEAYAAKKISRVAYDQVMKYKNTAYCAGCAGIFKVKLRNGKPKKITRIMEEEECYDEDYSFVIAMRKKGKYIYYIERTNGASTRLLRVGIKSHKKKLLEYFCTAYAIKGKKLYYTIEDDFKTAHRVMKLNGKGKKKTGIKVKMNSIKSNTKGYSVKNKRKGKYVVSYLKTPKGTFKLGKVRYYNF